jgi:hypothetical protein
MKAKRMKYADMTYRDCDALSFEKKIRGDDDGQAVNHVTKKRLKANKNAVGEVLFDPAGHK